jgi:Putative DNA-binding domain
MTLIARPAATVGMTWCGRKRRGTAGQGDHWSCDLPPQPLQTSPAALRRDAAALLLDAVPGRMAAWHEWSGRGLSRVSPVARSQALAGTAIFASGGYRFLGRAELSGSRRCRSAGGPAMVRSMPVQLPRLAKLLGAAIDEASADHIFAFIAKRVPEDAELDYKRANTYTVDNDGADELAKDVSGMANSRGGLIIIGIEEDEQACASKATPVKVTDKITGQMEQIIHARVIPFPNGTSVRAVEDPSTPGTGFYLITAPRSPLAPHAVRSTGTSSRPRYSYAHRGGSTTRWLEETEIASAYRDRFALARDHSDRAMRSFEESPFPPPNQVSATEVWLDLAVIPSVAASNRLDTGYISDVEQFLRAFRAAAPVPGLADGKFPTVARRRVHLDSGNCLLDLSTDGSAFIQAHLAWRPNPDAQAPVLWSVFLEYQVLGAIHLGAAYAAHAGGYGDADILARTNGAPSVYLETGRIGGGSSARNPVKRTSDLAAHITVPLDAIAGDPREVHLAARSIAADLLADYGQAGTRLLNPDGSTAYGLLEAGFQGPLRAWAEANDTNQA